MKQKFMHLLTLILLLPLLPLFGVTTIVVNQITRKVYKPIGGSRKLFPSLPAFDEFVLWHFHQQIAVPTSEASGWWGETEGIVGAELEDAGLILWVNLTTETRPNAANTILAIAGGFELHLDDFPILSLDFPEPNLYHEAVAGCQPYLYTNKHWTGLYIPIEEDDRLQPLIYGANVFGGADANVKTDCWVAAIKTK